MKTREEIQLDEDYVATQEDVSDSVDPLCSHDDCCHILILHVEVSETLDNTGNLSENSAAMCRGAAWFSHTNT